MSGPKAIETVYAGCRFRSRTEARWARFFDANNWRWEFEPEGFSLPSGNYLPDFRLHHPDGLRWFEVKPMLGPELLWEDRWADLVEATGTPLMVAYGMHRSGDDCDRDHAARFITAAGHKHTLPATYWRRYTRAWNAASSARFEFGEQG